jgi:phage antirepressor YoqD-like protein
LNFKTLIREEGMLIDPRFWNCLIRRKMNEGILKVKDARVQKVQEFL